MKRLVVAALALALLTAFGRIALEAVAPDAGSEAAIRATLREAAQGDRIDAVARAALADGDVALAEQSAALGAAIGRPVAPETERALAAETALASTLLRNAGDFLGAFVTGRATTGAGLAGAVASDLTVVGDVRDIASEGGKALVGAEYSELLLGLAAAGLAAEGVAVATGGAGLTARVGVSILKAAKRSGSLTVEFSTALLRLARGAGGLPPGGARAFARADPVGGAAATAARGAARARLARVGADLATVRRNAGTAEAVRLMRHVRSPDDLTALARFTGRFQDRARAVVRLTGKTTLRAFRTGARVVRTLLSAIVGFVAWLGGLVALALARRAYAATIGLVERAVGSLAGALRRGALRPLEVG